MRYTDLHCKTNFSFLEGASHPEELVARAAGKKDSPAQACTRAHHDAIVDGNRYCHHRVYDVTRS